MIYYDRIYLSVGNDINKTIESTECINYHYWCFLEKRITFQPYSCNGCHDILMISGSLSNVVILNIDGADFCYFITKCEVIKVIKNIDLTEKSRTIQKIFIITRLLSHIKMGKETLMFGNTKIGKR